MKKKIALLLAAVMTLALLPTNVFAVSTNTLSKGVQLIPTSATFVEQGLVNDMEVHKSDATGAPFKPDSDYYIDGTNLIIYLDTEVTTDAQFEVSLTNASWAFNGSYDDKATLIGKSPNLLWNTAYGNYFDRSSTATNGGIYSAPIGSSIDRRSFSTRKVYTRNGGLANGATAIPAPKTDASYYELPYDLVISEIDSKVATVYLNAGIATAKAALGTAYKAPTQVMIVIPLVVKVSDSGVSRVTLSGGSGINVSTVGNIFAEAGGGATKTWATGQITRLSSFKIDRLVIKESRLRTIGNGTFTLTTDNGYDFSLPVEDSVTKAGTTSQIAYDWTWNSYDSNGDPIIANGGYLTPVEIPSSQRYDFDVYRVKDDFRRTTKVFAEGGFAGLDNVEIVDMYFRAITSSTSSQKYDPTVLYVKISGLSPSTRTPGTLYIQNVKHDSEPLFTFTAQSNAPTGDWNLTIRNVKDTGITTESFKAGTRKDYNLELTAGEPRTLYNGLYEYTAIHDNHLAAEVKFGEVLRGAWLIDRTTTFTLPEGVKIRAMEITDMNGDAIAKSDNTIQSEVKYYPEANVQGKVFVDGNTITFTELTRKGTNDLAWVKMKLWLSIESGFTGDVTLTASGTGLGGAVNEVEPVVIAKAVDPITVEVDSITDIKVGLQYQSLADFTITEAKAGILRRGETVKVSVSDLISSDMSFISGFGCEVVDGDLKISNVRLLSNNFTSADAKTLGTENAAGNGTMAFNILYASGKASAIKFTNVQVKIDRTVPETNITPYKVIVWGTTIANNFNATTSAPRDTFQTPGIMVDYLKVATSATNDYLTVPVYVTIGDPVIKVGDRTVTMDTAAFIDPTSNSTMVPVRFVSENLGIPSDQVKWDDIERTVTIYNGSRIIQFKIGSDQIVVNGVSTTMLSPDGLAVKAQIKDERSFIPFRALGDALGVPVSWDPETQTAMYNAK